MKPNLICPALTYKKKSSFIDFFKKNHSVHFTETEIRKKKN